MAFLNTQKGLTRILLIIFLIFITSNYLFLNFLFSMDMHRKVKHTSREMDTPVFKELPFLSEMKNFPWDKFTKALQNFNSSQDEFVPFQALQRYFTLLLLKLTKFLVKPPIIPLNSTCENGQSERELLPTIVSSNNCIPLSQPRKVGILLQFGFDVDTLEIHLNELYNYVDKFFIIESIKPHSRFLSGKPLLWNIIKFQDRFMKFENKLVHFVVDDSDLSTSSVDNVTNIWIRESMQEELRWEKFLEWNRRTNYFSSDDLLGFGDADEISSVDNIIYLKHCHLPPNISSVDIGIWFPFDGLDSVFVSDYPVHGHPFTLGDPTFWTVTSALNYYNKTQNKFPSRMRGKSPAFLLGGSHLSRYAYPPYQMTKMLTETESSLESIERMIEIGMLFGEGNVKEANERLNYIPNSISNRTGSMKHFRSSLYGSKEYENIVKIPNFLRCNQKRYPGFWKQIDLRL